MCIYIQYNVYIYIYTVYIYIYTYNIYICIYIYIYTHNIVSIDTISMCCIISIITIINDIIIIIIIMLIMFTYINLGYIWTNENECEDHNEREREVNTFEHIDLTDT